MSPETCARVNQEAEGGWSQRHEDERVMVQENHSSPGRIEEQKGHRAGKRQC